MPKYYIKRYLALTMLGFLVLAISTALALGGSVPGTWWGYLLLLAEAVLASFFARALAKRRMHGDFRRILEAYDQACDPELFIELSAGISRRAGLPFKSWESFYESYRSLAYGDMGRDDLAAAALEGILQSIYATPGKQARAAMMMFAYAPAAALRGYREADWLLDGAESAFLERPGKHAVQLDFVARQRRIVAMQEEGDAAGLEEAWRKVRENPTTPLRAKVNAAFREAEALDSLGCRERREEVLAFAARNGPKLKAGREADELLGRMERTDG